MSACNAEEPDDKRPRFPVLSLIVGDEKQPGELISPCYWDSDESGCASGIPVDPPVVEIYGRPMDLKFGWDGPPARLEVSLCLVDDLYECEVISSSDSELPGATWDPSAPGGSFRLSAFVSWEEGSDGGTAGYNWIVRRPTKD